MVDLKRNLVILMGVTTIVVVISAMSLYKFSGLTSKHEVSDEVFVMVEKIEEIQSKMTHRMGQEKLEKTDTIIYSESIMALDLVKSFLVTKFVPTFRFGGDGESGDNDDDNDDVDASQPLVRFFKTEEIKKYLKLKQNRHKRKNFMGAYATLGAIGHACVSMKVELEEYMDYDVGDMCKDDWPLGQRLMVHGCDPLPRRRCLALGPKYYGRPTPLPHSLWDIPDDKNIRWTKYTCRSFKCLVNATQRGFSKCTSCFDLESHESPRWMVIDDSNLDHSGESPEFRIVDVLALKPLGEIRIGLDYSVSVGTFAARMYEHNVTIVTSTLNLGAPFNEFIALRGLIPLYISLNQRLPFFDNTLDLIHTNLLFDGWINLQFLDFIIFDWDRVLRPGGLLWIDRFFCNSEDLDDYLYMFLQLNYKKLKWVVVHKTDKLDKDEVFFSAILEKPPRPF